MKFVVSYSGGKDSMLALHRMAAAGHEPVGLLVMYRADMGRSWVHGIAPALLDEISAALQIPLLRCGAAAETYEADMERALKQAAVCGAEACVFGDIDEEAHRAWDEARCAAAGLRAELPLWGRDRAENVREVVALGYRCLIKCVQNTVLPETFLGRALSPALLAELEGYHIDLCGENGEYHTVVVDGPLFHTPVEVESCGVVRLGAVSAADLRAKRH